MQGPSGEHLEPSESRTAGEAEKSAVAFARY